MKLVHLTPECYVPYAVKGTAIYWKLSYCTLSSKKITDFIIIVSSEGVWDAIICRIAYLSVLPSSEKVALWISACVSTDWRCVVTGFLTSAVWHWVISHTQLSPFRAANVSLCLIVTFWDGALFLKVKRWEGIWLLLWKISLKLLWGTFLHWSLHHL